MTEAEKIVAVFGSSDGVEGEEAYETARAAGKMLAELGYVVATDRKVCREDVAKSEHYLRFLERYYGWKEDQWARMTDFLATESVREPLVNV